MILDGIVYIYIYILLMTIVFSCCFALFICFKLPCNKYYYTKIFVLLSPWPLIFSHLVWYRFGSDRLHLFIYIILQQMNYIMTILSQIILCVPLLDKTHFETSKIVLCGDCKQNENVHLLLHSFQDRWWHF